MYKIGVSKNPEKRLFDLSLGNRNISMIYKSDMISNPYFVESKLHKMFSENSEGREWFSGIKESNLLEIVKNVVEKFGRKDKKESTKPNKTMEETIMHIMETFYGDSQEIEKETKAIARENNAIFNIISFVSYHPESKGVVNALIYFGYEFEEIYNFLNNELFKYKS